jgi:hypothetical protein
MMVPTRVKPPSRRSLNRPSGTRAFRLVVVALVALASLAYGAFASESRRGLPHLIDRTFEHETQASSGRTTGHWLVLFTRDGKDNDITRDTHTDTNTRAGLSDRARLALSSLRDELLDFGVVAASVDVEESPETADRFRLIVKRTPAIVLLRDGKAYAREVRDADDAETLARFATTTFAEETQIARETEVPKELTYIQRKFARVTHALAMEIVQVYGKVDSMTRALGKDYARVSAAWREGGWKAAREATARGMTQHSTHYGLFCVIVGAVVISIAGVLAVVTYPSAATRAARHQKTKKE